MTDYDAAPPRRHYPALEQHEVAEGVSDEFKARMEDTLIKIPEQVMDAVKAYGYQLKFGPMLLALRPDLRNVRPRGHTPGKTFEHVDGFHDPATKQIYVFEYLKPDVLATTYARNTRAEAVFRHELGHAFDRASGDLSESPWFILAYEHDLDSITLEETIEQYQYYLQSGIAGHRETFAELLAVLMGGGPDRHVILKAVFTETCAALKKFLQR